MHERALRTLPNFSDAFELSDRRRYSPPALGARIVMQELPLFGREDGSMADAPWSGDGWKSGLQMSVFSDSMHPLAVAATYAFAHAVSDRIREIPLAEDGFLCGIGSIGSGGGDGTFLVDARDVRVVARVANDACVAIRRRMASEDEDDDSICEAAERDYADFVELLAVYMSRSDEHIGAIKRMLDFAIDNIE